MESKTADDFSRLTPHESVLKRPGVYGGSQEKISREVILFEIEYACFGRKIVDSPTLLIHMFIEIVANVYDNYINTKIKGQDPGKIEIDIGNKRIRVKNGGEPIPIALKEKDVYIPDMIFGNLWSGSNYDDTKEKSGIGQNGIGAKLTNIWSRQFSVKCGDPGFGKRKNNLEYFREWSNNMYTISDRQLEKYSGDAYVEITYEPDFKRFGRERFNSDDQGLMAKTAMELSFITKSKILLNGRERDYTTIEKFSPLCFAENCKYVSILIHGGKRLTAKEIKEVDKGNLRPNYAIYIFDIPGPEYAEIYSYANGFSTPHGGCHVAKVINKLKSLIKEKYDVNAKDIEKNIGMILVCNFGDPKYDSQTKYRLVNYANSAAHDLVCMKSCLDEIMKLEYFKNYIAELQGLKKDVVSKVNGKNEKHVNFKGRDANNAGVIGKNEKCQLMIVEGLSAEGYADDRRTRIGTDDSGYITLKGKVINVEKAPQERIDANEEITSLKMALGIKESDTKGNKLNINYFNVKERCRNLRYGNGVLILTDPDSDGMHIACLLLNFFSRIDGFLEAGLVHFLRPPLVRAYDKQGKIAKRLFDYYAIIEYQKTKNIKGKELIYFKGLGSCEESLFPDDLEHAINLDVEFEKTRDQEAIDICFGKMNADKRKRWIANSRYKHETIFMPNRKTITCDEMIMKGMRDYNIDTFKRALPVNLDGFKESQRKIVYAAFLKWDYGKKNDKEKTGIFANFVSAKTHYQHGETSLVKAVEEMTKNFKGSNNLNWFEPRGVFGNYKGNKAASARYTRLRPEEWIKYAYLKEIIDLVPKVKVEDHEAEPEWIPCDLPPYINCIRGIATGFSTFIPPHSVVDACDTVIYYCDHGHINGLPPIIPYAEKFSCPFTMEENLSEKIDETEEEETEEDEEISIDQAEIRDNDEEYRTIEKFTKRQKGKKFKSNGKCKPGYPYKLGGEERYDVTITELPWGYTANAFEEFVKKLLVKNPEEKKKKKKDETEEDKNIILSYEDRSELNEQYKLIIKGFSKRLAGREEYRFFGLQRSYPMTLMNMITVEGIPKYYTKVEEIFMDWAPKMSEMYRQYKISRLNFMQGEIDKLNDKIIFIMLVVKDVIKPKWKKEKYVEILAKSNLKIGIMREVSWLDCTEEEIEKLKNEIEKREKERDEFSATKHTDIWKRRVIDLKKILINKLGKTSQWEATGLR